MKNDSDEKTIVYRQSRASLSADNLLTMKVTDVDTWPFLPRGIISPDRESMYDKEKDRINKDETTEFQSLSGITTRLHERQIIVVSFMLAIAIGVLGNLAVSLLFGSINLQITNVAFLVFVLIVIAFLAYMIFLYAPLNLNYRVQFNPPWEYPRMSLPKLAEDKLTLKGRLEASYPSSFIELVLNYSNLLTVAILRDYLRIVAFKNLRITELKSLGDDYPFYTITIDFKHSWLFWKLKIPEEATSELISLNSQLMMAKILIGVHALDNDSDRWFQRGHVFINEVSTWDINDIKRKIENQIRSIKDQ